MSQLWKHSGQGASNESLLTAVNVISLRPRYGHLRKCFNGATALAVDVTQQFQDHTYPRLRFNRATAFTLDVI